VINCGGAFYSEVSGWETGKWRITGQENGITVVWGCDAIFFGRYISVFGTEPDTYIFMVKGLVFWDATKCGFVEKYGRFEGSFCLDLVGSDAV